MVEIAALDNKNGKTSNLGSNQSVQYLTNAIYFISLR